MDRRRSGSAQGPVAPALRVVTQPGHKQRGVLLWRGSRIPVALGRAGIRHAKKEGDGATPAGIWRLVELRWRADRGARPVTRLPIRPIRRDDGWCDDPADRRYNRPVRLPLRASHEEMWRADRLYDLVIVLDHNQRPRKARGGSAVFLHLERPDGGPTAGCVAFRPADLRRLLPHLRPGTRLRIG
ncbi:L,D-transpeptidase family protein [Ancylobacter terrae]|uniref:L,D-transpeptidase family protein n=1 Tax=Ancylobacter sp. sgz301288 TaxID=3342077 RepID=UPI00385CBA06